MRTQLGMTAVLLLMLAGCGSAPPQKTIISEFNPETDFRLYKTYRWFDGPFLPGDPATSEETQYHTVRNAINKIFRAKGYEWQQFEATDLVLHIHSGLDTPPEIDQWMTYNWYKPWWGAYGPMVEVSRFEPGMLVLDIIDAKNVELIWRGLIPDFYTPEGRLRDVEGFADRIQRALRDFPAAI
mgnify:CR=1 FL=1